MPDFGDGTPRPVWRPSAAAPPGAERSETPSCGGPELSVRERFELMRERRRRRKEAEAAQAGRDAARHPSRHRAEDDAEKPAKRYAVELLRQDNSAWGGGTAGSGDIG